MTEIAATAAIFVLAGMVKGVIGLGLPTLAMGLLGLMMPPVQAAALLVVPSLVTNIWQIGMAAPVLPLLRRFWPVLVAIPLGTGAGGGAPGTGIAAAIALGVALVAYAAYGLIAPPLRLGGRAATIAGPMAGFVTGAVSAGTGVFVIPVVPFLASLGLERAQLVAMLGLSFTVSTVALGAGLWAQGALPTTAIAGSLACLAPALAGMVLGTAIRGRISETLFRRCFFAGLGLLGAHMIARPLL